MKFNLFVLALAFLPLTALASTGVTYTGNTATQNFGTVNVATTSSPVSLPFSVGAGTIIGSIEVVTQGAPGLDFNNAGSGTCADQSYGSTTSCTVEVTFKPIYAGLRRGAVLFWSGAGNSGTLLGKVLIYGVGNGGQVVYLPPVISAVPTPEGAYFQPASTVVDSAGNLYVTDNGNGRLVEISAAGVASVIDPDASNLPASVFRNSRKNYQAPIRRSSMERAICSLTIPGTAAWSKCRWAALPSASTQP